MQAVFRRVSTRGSRSRQIASTRSDGEVGVIDLVLHHAVEVLVVAVDNRAEPVQIEIGVAALKRVERPADFVKAVGKRPFALIAA